MRSMLFHYGRKALAAFLVFVALSYPGHADDYGNARAAFNLLPSVFLFRRILLRTEYIVEKVVEHRQALRQLPLFDDEPKPEPS
jgi:hypothetical protein